MALDSWKTVQVTLDDGVAWVELNRPEKRNAMSPQLNREMIEVLTALDAEDACGVVVLTGAGESFSAGMDLKEYFREVDGAPDSVQRQRPPRQRAVAVAAPAHLRQADDRDGQRLVLRRRVHAGRRVRPRARRRRGDVRPLGGELGHPARRCREQGARRHDRLARGAALHHDRAHVRRPRGGRRWGSSTRACRWPACACEVESLARELLAKNPVVLRAAKLGFKHCRTMSWDQAEDYLYAKLEQSQFLDTERGREQGLTQFLDEKRIRPGCRRTSVRRADLAVDNLAGLLTDAAQAHAARPALLIGDTRMPFRELGAARARWAGLLRARGVGPGDRVALLLPNGLDYIAALYGTLAAGAIAVPLNPLLRRAEVEERLADSGASVLVAPAAAEELAGLPVAIARPVAGTRRDARRARSPSALRASPRSCSTPRARPVARRAPSSRTAACARARPSSSGPLLRLRERRRAARCRAVHAHLRPLGRAQSGARDGGVHRADAALRRRGGARADAARVGRGVPRRAVDVHRPPARRRCRRRRMPRLRVAHVGGAPLPPETLHAFAARFGCAVLEGYGMTETAGGVVSHVSGQVVQAGLGRHARPGRRAAHRRRRRARR